MRLRFELGDSQAPRGHAIVYARGSNPAGSVLATYCVVFPIEFSIGKFLPPMLAAQMPLGGLGEATGMNAVPIPPMMEEVTSLDALRQLAERRGDDLCDMGVVAVSDDSQRVTYAAEAAASYGQIYAEHAASWPSPTDPAAVTASEQGAQGELDVEDVLAEAYTDRDRLAELSRFVGMLRYAVEGKDLKLLAQTERSMRKLAASLPEKYRADQLIEAALRTDPTGEQLAQLYLQRAFRLLEEDYAAIPPIEQQIRDLRGDA